MSLVSIPFGMWVQCILVHIGKLLLLGDILILDHSCILLYSCFPIGRVYIDRDNDRQCNLGRKDTDPGDTTHLDHNSHVRIYSSNGDAAKLTHLAYCNLVRDGSACHIASSNFGPTNVLDRIAHIQLQSSQPHNDRHLFQGHTRHTDNSNDIQVPNDRRHNEYHNDDPSNQRHMYMHHFLVNRLGFRHCMRMCLCS